MEIKLKGRSNVWLEILEQSLKRRLGFWTRVVVLKMDFDKSAVKVFMSENQKSLNHLRLRNRNYWRYSVFVIFEKVSMRRTLHTSENFCDNSFVLCYASEDWESKYSTKSQWLCFIAIFNLIFLYIYGFGFFHGSFHGNRTHWRMLKNQFSSLRRRSRKSRKSKSCFRFWFISTLKSKFSRSRHLVPPMKVSIKKVKVLRVKDFVAEKGLCLFSASESWQLQNSKTC